MNLKAHIITSFIFLLLISGAVILLMRGEDELPQSPVNPYTERFIQIVSATWGENCNSQIEAMNRNQEKDNNGQIPVPVRKNNALLALSKVCNAKESCSVSVSKAGLGMDPISNCHKQMQVEYRCFMTDRAHKLDVKDNDTLTIDCRENAS